MAIRNARTPAFATDSSVNWDHPDNRGLVLLLSGLPGTVSGAGGRWPNLTGKTPGAVLRSSSAWAPWATTPAGQTGIRFSADTQTCTVEDRAGTDAPEALRITGPITLALTWQLTASGTASGIGRSDSLGNLSAINYYLSPFGSNVFFGLGDAAGNGTTVQAAGVATGGVQRAVGTWDGQTARLYLQGRLAASTSFTAAALRSTASRRVWVGKDVDPGIVSAIRGTAWDARILARGVDANWVARDYRWSLDPSTDPRLNRLLGRTVSLPAAATAPDAYLPAFAAGWGW